MTHELTTLKIDSPGSSLAGLPFRVPSDADWDPDF